MSENHLLDASAILARDWPPVPKWKRVWWWLCRAWENFCGIPFDIRCFIQRGRRGWSDRDWWNLDHYIAEILVGALAKMRERGHGYPGCPGAETPEEWDAILAEMIAGFRIAAEDDDLFEGEGAPCWWCDRTEYERAMELFHKWFPALWD